ncbi:expressed unknown protein [Seminavis robusta]|uniref:Uncharacterized protein n=1 Tax=Seminavis robusta TaxID=568900 RepID=A0A9N8EVB7_9STRA|nr:expressed unknown protein [Seminavis robusta]|eukprot:Sro1789_g297660.1 n/a (596) ;mRNA; r:8766-10553
MASSITTKHGHKKKSCSRNMSRLGCFLLLVVQVQLLLTGAAAARTTTLRGVRKRPSPRYYSVSDADRQLDKDADNKNNNSVDKIRGTGPDDADTDDYPAFSGASRKEAKSKHKSQKGGTRKSTSSKQQHSKSLQQHNSHNVFDHDTSSSSSRSTHNETSHSLHHTGASQDAEEEEEEEAVLSQEQNNNLQPDKVPMQPVQCARAMPIQSALLVRMVGEPSLLTRFEKFQLGQVVRESYNEWMQWACDGFHRSVEQVEILPVDNNNNNNVALISQAHEEAWLQDQGVRSNNNQDEEDASAMLLLVEAEEFTDEENELVKDGGQPPSPAPTSQYKDPNSYYHPLYWFSISATCRNCPRSSRGNSNLLARHASSMTSRNDTRLVDDAAGRPALSAASLILQEVCFCPLAKVDDNGTEPALLTLDRLFPDAKAPTSEELLEAINGRIQQLRSDGTLLHVERLIQLTEPDYAYYAEATMLETEHSIDETTTSDGTVHHEGGEEPANFANNNGENASHDLESTEDGLGEEVEVGVVIPPNDNSPLETTPTSSTAPTLPAAAPDISPTHSPTPTESKGQRISCVSMSVTASVTALGFFLWTA